MKSLWPIQESTATPNTEVYIRKPSTRGADVYQVKAGYAALPKLDKREESFVRVQVPGSQMGIDAIHIPCLAIRDYFFSVDRTRLWVSQKDFYYLLGLPRDVTFKELRLGYRLRRMELQEGERIEGRSRKPPSNAHTTWLADPEHPGRV